jgi:uncharacterized membrane protein
MMFSSYNRVAGQSVERLAALSDGIFGAAMTLLAIDLSVPVKDSIHSEHDFWHAWLLLEPTIFIYLISFLTLGIFWIGQQSQLNHLGRSAVRLTWIHLIFLLL